MTTKSRSAVSDHAKPRGATPSYPVPTSASKKAAGSPMRYTRGRSTRDETAGCLGGGDRLRIRSPTIGSERLAVREPHLGEPVQIASCDREAGITGHHGHLAEVPRVAGVREGIDHSWGDRGRIPIDQRPACFEDDELGLMIEPVGELRLRVERSNGEWPLETSAVGQHRDESLICEEPESPVDVGEVAWLRERGDVDRTSHRVGRCVDDGEVRAGGLGDEQIRTKTIPVGPCIKIVVAIDPVPSITTSLSVPGPPLTNSWSCAPSTTSR